MNARSLANGLFDRVSAYLPIEYKPKWALTSRDFFIAFALAALGVAASTVLFSSMDHSIYLPKGQNVWFDADAPRALGAMEAENPRWLQRNKVHPLFSVMTIPPFQAFKLGGMTSIDAGMAIILAVTFATIVLLYLSLRGIELPRVPAAAFTMVFISSATFMHWFGIIETYSLGSLSVTLMLFVLIYASETNWILWTLASAATLGVTITSWMVGLAAAAARLDLRRAILVSAYAFLIVAGLAAVAQFVLPGSVFFLEPGEMIKEYYFTQIKTGWTPLNNIWSFVISSAVAPAPYIEEHLKASGVLETYVSNQHFRLPGYGFAGLVSILAWLVMIVGGIVGGLRSDHLRAVFATVAVFLLGQFLLHLVYGTVTFLFAANFFPAFILLCAFGWFTPWRSYMVGAALVFILFGGYSNWMQVQAALELAHTILSSAS